MVLYFEVRCLIDQMNSKQGGKTFYRKSELTNNHKYDIKEFYTFMKYVQPFPWKPITSQRPPDY